MTLIVRINKEAGDLVGDIGPERSMARGQMKTNGTV